VAWDLLPTEDTALARSFDDVHDQGGFGSGPDTTSRSGTGVTRSGHVEFKVGYSGCVVRILIDGIKNSDFCEFH
jgi:hypothetical protein